VCMYLKLFYSGTRLSAMHDSLVPRLELCMQINSLTTRQLVFTIIITCMAVINLTSSWNDSFAVGFAWV